MPNEYSIICTVDRLGPQYGGTDIWFGLNLSAGITKAEEALDPNLLKPWLWKIEKMLISIEGADATEVLLEKVIATADTKAIRKHFDELFTKNSTTSEFFLFEALKPSGHRWPSALGHLSTSVAPIPQTLNLTRFFKLASVDEAKKVFAAPIIEVGGKTFTPKKDKAAQLWEYDDPTVKAHQPGTIPGLPKGSMIDLATQWIESQIPGEEWRSTLEKSVAALFDLGQLLIDAARLPETQLTDAHAHDFRDVVLLALHDLAGTGAAPRPDGRTLAHDVVAAADVDAVLKALLDYEKTVTLSAWRELLQTLPRAAEQLPALDAKDIAHVATALDAVQAVLADEVELRAIVRAQWSEALEARGDVAAILGRFDSLVPNIQLRDRLALSNLGRFWKAINTIPQTENDDRKAIRKNMIDALLGYYVMAKGSATLPDAFIRAELTKAAEQAADAALKTGSLEPTKTAHPVTLQLDRLFDVDDRDDFLRRISGAGLLMRRGTDRWRMLTAAAVHERIPVKKGEPIPAPGDLVVKAAVVPYRMQFVNDLRQTFVSYNNHPLIARSQADGLKGPLVLTADDVDADVASVLQYEPAPAADEWNLLPALVFGERYELLPFAIGNSGALPALLAKKDDPITFRTSKEFGELLTADENKAIRDKFVKPLDYKRRVPVGNPRFSGLTLPKFDIEQAQKDARLPSIPESVVPLARDSGVPNDVAILLLADDEAVTFGVRPPAVDINTWDRWVARKEDDTAAMRIRRKAVWAEVHRRLPSHPGDSNQKRDVSLDDPAVEKLRFELEGVGQVDVALTVEAATGIASVQALPIAVSCTRMVSGAPSIAVSNGRVTVRMPRGMFRTLRIKPLLFADATDRLEVPLKAEEQLVIEAVSPELPSAEELWKALDVSAEKEPGKLVVSLRRQMGDKFHLVKSVELERQLWRWDGRPIDPFPFDKVTSQLDTNDAVRKWEVQAFASRRDSDALTFTTAVNFAGDAAPDRVIYVEDLTTDPRAHYLRYAVRVRSRYRGLVESVSASRHIEGKSATPWKRGLIRCRPDVVKKPKVKLVLPLTEAGAGERAPGLLVVLNEPWFEVGGLAEQLRAEIIRTPLPDQPPGPLTPTLPELGTDPIVDVRGFVGEPQLLPALPPVGFTFDTDTDAPLFVSSSFFVPAPKVDGVVQDLAWHFARLRFTRAIDGKGINNFDGSDRISEPTESHWVQLLPDARSYRVKDSAQQLDVAKLRVERVSKAPFILRSGTSSVVLLPAALDETKPEERLFDLWLLLTQEITDVYGRRNQEKYLGMYRWNAAGELQSIDGPALPPADARLVVRVVEIQQRPDMPLQVTEGKWWEGLFNKRDDSEHDVAARVVRVSPPIRM